MHTAQKQEAFRGLGLGLGLSTGTDEEASSKGQCMSLGSEGGHRRKGTQWVLSTMEVLFYQPAAGLSSTSSSSSREAPSLSLQSISIGSFCINTTETVPVFNPQCRHPDNGHVKPITKPQSKPPVRSTHLNSQSNRKAPFQSTGQCNPVAEALPVQFMSRKFFETQAMCVTFFEKYTGNDIDHHDNYTLFLFSQFSQSNPPVKSPSQILPSHRNLISPP